MSFEFGSGVIPGTNTFQTTWTWWPTDTLDALDLMLVYFRLNDKCVRPRPMHKYRRDSENLAPMNRCLHDKAIRSAVAIIHPGRCCPERRALQWYVTPTMDIKGRLRSAGINIDTVLVVDERRWAFCWQQVSSGNQGITFGVGMQERLVASDFPTPVIEPIVKRVTTTWGKGQQTRKTFDFQKKNNFIYEGRKKIYRPDLAPNSTEKENHNHGPAL